ncbi:GGDEF domain-containing protein [Cellulomonas marina]|uniref:Diguanylate cyclase (GGDEF) domain-containing protein n=1 Tax=Cellulomonas marina TaxID=988821 RepID=A0A1I0V3P1_9CELL|nr:GGDEF domain-containing protein [Cellulomonas marina]GIG28309.1 hypothetical protein Cma02nite_09090 [Cellulomonas marina]SFA70901.1 diguanylate cyclase (GGDEF) domain-containing protein [Cellulomonas marina]
MGMAAAWGPGWTTFWRRHTRMGVALTFLVAAGVGLRSLARPETVDAAQLAVLVVVPAATCLVLLVPVDRLVQHPRGWAFFVSWEVAGMLLVGWLVWRDGGLASPLVLFWYVLLTHAVSAYPPVWTALAGAPVLAVHAALLIGASPAGRLHGLEHLLAAAGAVGVAVWASRNRYAYLRRVADQAQRDDLTGCANRRTFHERLAVEQGRTDPDRPLGVVLLDLDHFKAVNDGHGHAAGDAVLMTVGRTLGRVAADDGGPSGRVAGRLGGDEFGLVLPGADAGATARTAEALAAALADALAPTGVTASIGTATARTPAEATRLLADADAALYRAKHAGRNRVVPHGA